MWEGRGLHKGGKHGVVEKQGRGCLGRGGAMPHGSHIQGSLARISPTWSTAQHVLLVIRNQSMAFSCMLIRAAVFVGTS